MTLIVMPIEVEATVVTSPYSVVIPMQVPNLHLRVALCAKLDEEASFP
jgi:hypothetical protein